MSDKSEELIEKTNGTSNKVSKRTIKLPTSVTGKKKDVDSKPINNIIPIESLKEKSLSSKKTKRTLHLNLGNEQEEVKNEIPSDENSVTMVIPKISTIEEDKAKLLDTLLDVDVNSPSITPSTVTSNKSFLDEPSVFEKFDININNKITSASSQLNAEPTINLNSSFFYEPSVFEKYSIEISETDSNDDVIETKNENIVEEKNIEKSIEEKIEIEPIVNQNSIDTPSSLSLNDLISIDDETESIDDILNATVSTVEIENEESQEENDTIIDEELLDNLDLIDELPSVEECKELLEIQAQEEISSDLIFQDNSDIVDEIIDEDIGDIIDENNFDDLINSNDIDLIDELAAEENDYNLLDLVEDDSNLLTEAADSIKTPESNTTSNPVGIFIENSGTQKNNDASLFSKAKKSIVSNITSVFKKFSYDEAANLAATIDNDDIDETPIQNVNPISDINQVLGNIEAEPQEKSVTELDITADSIGVVTPIIEESILDTSSNETEINSLNILTPETSTSDFSDDELLDLLEFDSSNNELIDSFKSEDIEFETNSSTSIEDELLEKENNELDLESENIEIEEDSDDDFSIEDYFGIEKDEDSDIVQEDIDEEYEEEFEENIEDLLDDDADIEFDEELSTIKEQKVEESQTKMSGEELLSLSKLFDNLTTTISSLSNRISELENTKMQPVIIEPEAIKQAIEQVATKPSENVNTNVENNIIEENIVENNDEEDVVDNTILEENIEENIIQDEIEPSILEENIEDISLDDIDLEDLSGLTISDVLNENDEETIAEAQENLEQNISSDINLDDININDLDLNDIDLEDISLSETEEQIEQNEESSIEDLLTTALSSDKNLDDQKEELLLELLSGSNEGTSENTEENSISDEEPASDFIKIIDSLSKAISELEQNSLENPILPISSDEEPVSTKDLGIDSNKAFNILINKDDIFSISILNETYEIVADFDGISVLSENIHISTPKKNFFLKVGNKNIEIHNYKKYFLVYTTFEDVEFANAINNVTFAKKNGRIELNIKEAFKLSSTNNVLELSMLNTSIAKIPSTTPSNSEQTNNVDDSSVCDNKTLVISEETQKVYLPYTMADVMEKLNNSANGYQTIEEVVEKEYVVPLSDFKMPIISRFKEAYRFMRVKEKSSVYEALDLALELMFNSNLNPAIIRAAKDLKELDIYLDCLYENELDKFDRFKIIYKVLPKVQN